MAEHPNAVRTPHVGGASIPCLPACTAKGVEMAQQGSLGVFSFEGYDTFTKKAGLTSGEGTPSNVDFDSHHVLMNLKYWETHWLYKNANNTVCNTYDQWNEKGIWQPAGGQYIKKGQQMWGQLSKADQDAGKTWRADGYNALKALKNKGHFKWLGNGDCGWHAELSRGKGITYGVAASVGGIGIRAETDHSNVKIQSADARGWTCQTRPDFQTGNTDTKHWFWGYDGSVPSVPKAFYMY